MRLKSDRVRLRSDRVRLWSDRVRLYRGRVQKGYRTAVRCDCTSLSETRLRFSVQQTVGVCVSLTSTADKKRLRTAVQKMKGLLCFTSIVTKVTASRLVTELNPFASHGLHVMAQWETGQH